MSISIRPADLEREGGVLLALQRAGYAEEARLIGVDSLPAQHETVTDLRRESLWVAEVDEEPAGLLGIEDGDEPLLALYESLGFEQVGERMVGDGLPFVDLRMQR